MEGGGFIPLGCDGTRQACPRSGELERHMGASSKEGSSPMLWNTSIVHLTLGFPLCWRLGKGGKASERSHLLFMLRWLPAAALIVADAGYVGYEVIRGNAGKSVLSHPHVFDSNILYRSPRAVGGVSRGDRLLLAENAGERGQAATSWTLDADS